MFSRDTSVPRERERENHIFLLFFFIYSLLINYNSKSLIYHNIQKLGDFVSCFGLKSVSFSTLVIE